MSTCYPFRPVPGQRGPRGCGPVPAPPSDPRDYWATKKFVSSLVSPINTSVTNLQETKLDRSDVVDPAVATEAGKAADAKKTQDELTRISGVASDAKTLAESKADKLSDQQLEAVNSGIDADKVAKIAQNEIAISAEVSRATTEEARLQALINAIKTFDAVVADSLPIPSEQYIKKLYLIPSTNPETRNVKDEFICVKIEDAWGWEQVGSTAITIEFDNEPTEGSQKAARSGGIWSFVNGIIGSLTLGWEKITGKPSTFPPSDHNHTQSQVTGLADALANKLPSTLSSSDSLSVENPDPLELPIPMIEYTVLDLVAAKKGWIWNGYAQFNNLLGKPTTLAGYGITDAYTKAEADAKLDGKANKNGDSIEDFAAKDINSTGTLTTAEILCGSTIHADGDINCLGSDGNLHHLASKANRAESGHADEIATLDADGNPTHSGYKPSDFAPNVSGGYIPVQGCDYFPDKGSGAFWGNDCYGFGSGSADNAFSFIMFDEWWPTYNRDRPYSVPAISLAWFGLENHVLLKGYGTQVAENTKWYYMKGNPTTSPVPGDEIAVMDDLAGKADRSELDGYVPTKSGDYAGLSVNANDEYIYTTPHASAEFKSENELAVKGDLDDYLPLTGGNMTGGLIVHGDFETRANFYSSGRFYLGGVKEIYYDSDGRLSDDDGGYARVGELPAISATDATFSNAVRAVGLNIDTNSVAILNEIAATFGGFPIEGTATTVGGLLAALAAAAAWLKKNKVQTLKLNDGSVVKTAENGVAKLDDFFTESNSLLTGTIDAEVISKGTAPDAHLEAPTDEHLKLILADNSVAYDSAKALPYKLTSAIGDRVIATMTLTAASTDITLPTIAANDTTVKDFILDVTNAYAVEGVATDAGINIPRTDFKLVTRDGESLTDVTTVKAGKSAFICFTQKSPVVVDGTTYPCWCVIQLPFGDPS